MTDQQNNRKKKLEGLLKYLTTKNPEKQLEALDALRMCGNETVIVPLLVAFASTSSPELRKGITDVLNSIKSSKAPAVIMQCLADPKFSKQRLLLLSSIWNSGLDYQNYLVELVALATEGDLMEVFEIETIIENLEHTPSDEILNEALLVIGNYLSEHKNESDSRIDLLIQIGVQLKKLNDD